MERQVQPKNRGCNIGVHVPRQRLGYLASRRCTVALDAGTHLDVGWAGLKGDMGVAGQGGKKGMGYVITSEKSGTGTKE